MAHTQTAERTDSRQRPIQEADAVEIGRDLVEYLREYVRENPEKAALWSFGIGFVLGWKLKIW